MIVTHIFDLFSLLFYTSCILVCLIGWGAIVKKFIGIPLINMPRFSDSWIGLVAVIAFIETCHLYVPIDWKVSLAFLFIGILGLSISLRRHLRSQFFILKNALIKNSFLFFIGFLIFLMWGSLALTTPNNYDSGLYHFQSIRWLNEYPIVLGLGNVHGRFAFNQTYFSFVALLNFFPFFNKGYAIGGLLMMTMGVGTLFEAHLNKILGGWWLVIWFFITYIAVSRSISSPSPDMPVVVMECCVFIFLVKIYACQLNDRYELISDAVTIFLLSCLLVTVKLSAAVFSLASILLIVPILKPTLNAHKKIYICSFLVGCYLIALHLLRGVLVSGLPLYPSSFGALWGMDWSVPREQAQSEANWIYSWARAPNKDPSEVLGSWAWFPGWSDRIFKENWRYIYGGLLLIGLDLSAFLVSKEARKDKRLFLLFSPLIAGTLFWFITAPDWRFLGAIPQLIIALSGFLFLRFFIPEAITYHAKKVPIFIIPILVGITCFFLVVKSTDIKTLPLIGWHPAPQIEVRNQVTKSGLVMLVPIQGDQCWDSPLPCTPYFNEALHLRSGSPTIKGLESGFSQQK
jgi:hypothetical protein